MTAARFKDLCMDATDALLLGRFWARALGGELVDLGDTSARVDPPPGRPSTEAIWVNPVPEPRTGKNRVHLDLRLTAPDPAPLVEAGARIIRTPSKEPWWVLADPDGNLLCAFPPAADGSSRPGAFELVVDCRDATAQATWWAGLVGGTVRAEGDAAAIEGAAGFPWQSWVFDPVPAPKTAKNRMHWDVQLTAATPAALIEAGATLVREPDDEIFWWVCTDPEGNEFCAFAPNDAAQ